MFERINVPLLTLKLHTQCLGIQTCFYKVKDRKSFSLYKSLLYGMPCACLYVQVGNINGERKECYQPIKHIHGLNRPYLTSLPQSLALQIYCVAVLGLVVQYSYRTSLFISSEVPKGITFSTGRSSSLQVFLPNDCNRMQPLKLIP